MGREYYIIVVRKGTNDELGEAEVTFTKEIHNLGDLCKELVKEDSLVPILAGLDAFTLLGYTRLNDDGKLEKKIFKSTSLDGSDIDKINGLPSIVIVADIAPGRHHLQCLSMHLR